MYHPFSIADTIKTAWNVIKKNYISLIVYTIATFLCNIAIKFLSDNLTSDNLYTSFAFRLVIMLIEAYLTLAFYKLLLTLIDREYYEFSFSDIWPSFRMAINAVAIGVILIFLIGTILFLISRLPLDPETYMWLFKNFIFPLEIAAVIYFGIRFIFCLCFVVDDDSGPIESLRQSWQITRNNFFKLIALVLIVILFVAAALLVIDLLITPLMKTNSGLGDYLIDLASIIWFAIAFPVVQVMIIATYRKLVYSHKDVDDDVSETL